MFSNFQQYSVSNQLPDVYSTFLSATMSCLWFIPNMNLSFDSVTDNGIGKRDSALFRT